MPTKNGLRSNAGRLGSTGALQSSSPYDSACLRILAGGGAGVLLRAPGCGALIGAGLVSGGDATAGGETALAGPAADGFDGNVLGGGVRTCGECTGAAGAPPCCENKSIIPASAAFTC